MPNLAIIFLPDCSTISAQERMILDRYSDIPKYFIVQSKNDELKFNVNRYLYGHDVNGIILDGSDDPKFVYKVYETISKPQMLPADIDVTFASPYYTAKSLIFGLRSDITVTYTREDGEAEVINHKLSNLDLDDDDVTILNLLLNNVHTPTELSKRSNINYKTLCRRLSVLETKGLITIENTRPKNVTMSLEQQEMIVDIILSRPVDW